MDKIPFDAYDFFGYLSSGLVILVGSDMTFGFPILLGRNFNAVESGMLILAIYVAGQIAATPAKALLEDIVLGHILKKPHANLFRPKAPKWRRLLFPGYFAPLPPETRQKILDKVSSENGPAEGEALFLHVRFSPKIRDNEKTMGRLNAFLNKYGFNRNLSFGLLLTGTVMVLKARFASPIDTTLIEYGTMALVVGVLLFYRYLKFFRQYSYEMFNSYARTP